MARITVEDCLKHVSNMYELVHVATRRARMIYKGGDPVVRSKNRVIVTALREVAAGFVTCELISKEEVRETEDQALPQ